MEIQVTKTKEVEEVHNNDNVEDRGVKDLGTKQYL